MPGICTSVITQSASFTRSDLRNASAESNAAVPYPSDRTKLVVARRNESSSSTIAITGIFGKLASFDDERNKTSSRAMHDSDGNVQLSERDEKLHQGIVSLSFCATNPQKVRHLHEVGQRLRPHLPRDLTPVHFDRDLGNADLRRDLLVQ